MDTINRRQAIRLISGSSVVLTASRLVSACSQAPALKGNISHSVCRWCYPNIPLEELCRSASLLGLESIELLGPDEWPLLKKYNLTCAMPWGAGKGITKGWNDRSLHAELLSSYEDIIPKAARAGFSRLICFSGNRNGKGDEEGLENCTVGLKQLMGVAEKYKVTVSMELLNSRVNHKDYQCDHTDWGVELVKRVGSERFKLLYDIYHMQIMEGNVIATIRRYHPYFSHYHTGGIPGRNEIDQTQELYYPAIMKAILATGFKGYVAQEFIPKHPDALESLRQSIRICDV